MAPKGETTCPVSGLGPGLLGSQIPGPPAFGSSPPVPLPQPTSPTQLRRRPPLRCQPSLSPSPHRSMANLSILFGQVSGRVGVGLVSHQHHPCAAGTGCRAEGTPHLLHVGAQAMLLPLPPVHSPTHPSQVVRGLSAGARVFEYMTLSSCIPLSGGCCIPREHLCGSITFHNVSFRSVSVGGHGPLPPGWDLRANVSL